MVHSQDQPILTVITPVLDARQTLGQAIASVGDHLGSVAEHIVVDGYSSDGSWEVANHHPRVRAIRQPPRGISAAINLGITKAQGTYIVVLNADDQFLPQVSEVVSHLSEAEPPRPIFYTHITQHDPFTDVSIDCNADVSLIHKYMSVYHSGLFVPADMYATIGVYREDYHLAMDSNFVHRCAAAEASFVKLELNVCKMELRGRSHIQNNEAMREFEKSVVETRLQSPLRARFYRLRQTLFHTMYKYPAFQRFWNLARRVRQGRATG